MGWGNAPEVKLATPPATFDPATLNPWYDKVANPTFVTTHMSVQLSSGGTWTGPDFQATDVETVLGRLIDKMVNYSGAAPIPPNEITNQINAYVAVFPALNSPMVAVWGPMADQLVAIARAHKADLPK